MAIYGYISRCVFFHYTGSGTHWISTTVKSSGKGPNLLAQNLKMYVMIWKEFSRVPDFLLYLSNMVTTLVVHGLRFHL